MNPLISVIVPVYQVENYLDNCVESILNQSYKNIEIILIDDGSTDGSEKKCQSYIKKFDNVFGIRQKNKGASAARNLGINISNGEYIFFMDADDVLSHDCIECAVRYMDNNQWLFFDYHNGVDTNEHYSEDEQVEYINQSEGIKRILNINVVNNRINGYLWNKLFEASIIKKNGISFDEGIQMWEDLLFCLQYSLFVHRIAYIHKKMYFYRNNNLSSVSRTLSVNASYSWVKAGVKINNILQKRFQNKYIDFESQLVNVYMTYLINAISVNSEIIGYQEKMDFIGKNRKKLRKKYRLYFSFLKLNKRVGFLFIKLLNKLSSNHH